MQALDEIYRHLDREEITASLEPKNRGDYLELRCPSCGKRRAYLYKDGTTIRCNRMDSCGISISLFDWVRSSFGLTSNADVLQFLAKSAGVDLKKFWGKGEGDYSPRHQRSYSLEEKNLSHEDKNNRDDFLDGQKNFVKGEFGKDDGLESEAEGEKRRKVESNFSYEENSNQAVEEFLQRALAFFQEQLFSPGGLECLKYLQDRGYSDDEIAEMGLGFYPSPKALRDFLSKAEESNLSYEENVFPRAVEKILFTKNFGVTHQLVIPFHDEKGQLKGFILRSLLGEDELAKHDERKYKYNAGLKPGSVFFNLHRWRKAGGSSYSAGENSSGHRKRIFEEEKNLGERLVVVEGYLDALICTARGMRGVVAIGGALPTKKQVRQAVQVGAKRFILALDNDEDREGVAKRVRRSLQLVQQCGGRGYVIDWSSVGESNFSGKDPDELVRAYGIKAFEQLVENALAGPRFMAQLLLEKYGVGGGTPLTDLQRDELIAEALDYGTTIEDPIDHHDFFQEVVRGIGISIDDLKPQIKNYQARKEFLDRKKNYERLLFEMGRRVHMGRLTGLDQYVSEEVRTIHAKSVGDVVAPYTEQMAAADLAKRGKGLQTGFAHLDNYFLIPKEAITVVAGRPAHGKTTLLLNIFLNMIDLYPKKKFFFFSYEQSKSELYIRIINILAGYRFDQYKNLAKVEAYLRRGDEEEDSSNAFPKIPEIEMAKEKYNHLVATGRLWLVEEPYDIGQLVDALDFLAGRNEDMGAVFVDYIQKIKVKEKFQSRQVEIQKVSEQLLETTKRNHFPIVVGAQFNREVQDEGGVNMASLRESGDIEQDASLILGLYNGAFTQAEEMGEQVLGGEIELSLKIIKNRNGLVNKSTKLVWDLPVSKIRDGRE